MRVRLRVPSFADAAHAARCMQDPEAMRWVASIPAPYLPQAAIDFATRSALAKDYSILADGEFAGLIRTGADLGYWVAPEFRGRGVARLAVQLALLRHFQDSDEPSRAWYFVGNEPSRKVLVAAGYQDVGEAMMTWQGDVKLPARMMWLAPADFLGALEIRTPRCRIDVLRETDLPELHRIVTQPEVARMLLRFAPGQSLAEVEAIMRPAMNTLRRPMRLAIRHEGRFIGSIGLNDGAEPLIYYFLHPEMCGQGIASEVVPAFCDSVQDWFDLDGMAAAVFTDNPASRRVLEKAGFRVEFEDTARSAGRDTLSSGWYMRRG